MFGTPALLIASFVTLFVGICVALIAEQFRLKVPPCSCGHELREHDHLMACLVCRCRHYHAHYPRTW